jgi:alpha-tubulin suppressor-like RCC1 family protein
MKQKCIQVACGGSHTLVLNADNNVYAFGDNTFGQLGLSANETSPYHIPKLLYFF